MSTIGEIFEALQEIEMKEAILLSLNQRLYREQREGDSTGTEKDIEALESHLKILKSKEI
jgi:hypothetical protein